MDFSLGGHGIERCNEIGNDRNPWLQGFWLVSYLPRNLAIFLGEMVEMLPANRSGSESIR